MMTTRDETAFIPIMNSDPDGPDRRYQIVQKNGDAFVDIIQTDHRSHAFKRFQEFVANGRGTNVTLWDNATREYLATAEYSAANRQEISA